MVICQTNLNTNFFYVEKTAVLLLQMFNRTRCANTHSSDIFISWSFRAPHGMTITTAESHQRSSTCRIISYSVLFPVSFQVHHPKICILSSGFIHFAGRPLQHDSHINYFENHSLMFYINHKTTGQYRHGSMTPKC